jgi:hypothetical protein
MTKKEHEMKDEITIDGITYERKKEMSKKKDGMEYCIVRTYSAGVFAGYIESREGQEVVMREARRIWYWDGAASLSQLAIDGTNKPENCKFPEAVDRVVLTQSIEILTVTDKAKKSIDGVEIWRK